MTIRYLEGDATDPQSPGHKVIVHVCNDLGGWGRGFVLALSKRWPEPERDYRQWFASEPRPSLGDVQFVTVEAEITVANMVGQHGLRRKRGNPPIRYEAVRTGLETVAAFAKDLRASVHMPRIGCGLAGGEWHLIEPIIQETLAASGIETTVYDFGGSGG